MTSQLEKIASAVRGLGAGTSPGTQAMHQAQRAAGQLAAAVVDPELPSSQQAAQYLDTARRALQEALAELSTFQQDANAFASRLAGGGARAGGAPRGGMPKPAVDAASATDETEGDAGEDSASPGRSAEEPAGPKTRRSPAITQNLLTQSSDDVPSTHSAEDDLDDGITLSLEVTEALKNLLLGESSKALGTVAPLFEGAFFGGTMYSTGKSLVTAVRGDDGHERASGWISTAVGVAQISAWAAATAGATVALPLTPMLSIASIGIGFTEIMTGKSFTKAFSDMPEAIRRRIEKMK